MSDGYQPPYTLGGGCGCAAALCFFLPLAGVWILAVSLGDCSLDHPCHRHDGLLLFAGTAMAALIATIFGLSVRAVVNWRRRRTVGDAEIGEPPVWAVVLILLLIAALGFLLTPLLAAFW